MDESSPSIPVGGSSSGITHTDTEYKFGPLNKGSYGDVPVYFYESQDDLFPQQWRKVDGGIYLHNSRTFWKDTNTPQEVRFWATGKLPERRKDFINMTDKELEE